MNVLAIDTGGDCFALTLRINGKHAADKIVLTQRDQAKILAPLTQELLAAHKLHVSDIDRFGIATGPGSFTGLRVGLAFVRGLALASGKKAYGFDHFTITAHALHETRPVLIIRESKRADLFCAWLENGKLGDYFLKPAQELVDSMPQNNFAITGNGAPQLVALNAALKNAFIDIPDAALTQSLAELTENANSSDQQLPQPLYMRGADVTKPKQAVQYS